MSLEDTTHPMDSQYPIGRFERPAAITPDDRRRWIADIEALPEQLAAQLARIGAPGLETPYRSGGWTGRLVVHHLADSHMNCFIRFRLGLTETKPVVKTYEEAAWALLADSQTLPVAPSLAILAGVHERWTVMLRSMGDAEFARSFVHPDLGELPLDVALALYSWHGRHHLAHLALIPSAV